MINKKGVSTIVVTVILVALVLIAIGVVWAVVSGLIGKSTQTVNYHEKCLSVSVQATRATCTEGALPNGDTCDILVQRLGTGTDAIGGVKLVFKNASNGIGSAALDSADATPPITNIEPLVTESVPTLVTTLDSPNRVETTIYFLDEQGNERVCPQTTYYNW